MAESKKSAPKVAAPKKVASPAKPVEAGLSLPVYDLTGKKVGTAPLEPAIFKKPASPALLATYVRVYLANQRQGNASAKTRSEVIGSTKKIYKQKGTGRARHGSRKASLFRGGGVTFGPLTRDFSREMNKKQKKAALFGALSATVKEGRALGLADAAAQAPVKTKTFVKFLKGVEAAGSTLIVVPKMDKNSVILSSRNIPGVSVADAKSVNAYELMKSKKIIFVKSALTVMSDHFLGKHEN